MVVVSGGLFGLFFASTFSFTPIILADLVPIDSFTMAYGLVLLCQGIGNLIGPPLAGTMFLVILTPVINYNLQVCCST